MPEKIELRIPKTKKDKKKGGKNNYIFSITVDIPNDDRVKKYSDLFGVPKKEKEYEKKLKYDNETTITDIKVRENALEEIFHNYYPYKDGSKKPSKIEELTQTLIKVTLLNNYYSTRIDDDNLVAIARQIVELDAHSRLKKSYEEGEPDCKLVNQIAYYRKDIEREDKSINSSYSFASKYCSWHYPKLYPIVDSYTKGFLYHLNEALKNNEFIDYSSDIRCKSDCKTGKEVYFNDYFNYVELYRLFKEKFKLKDTKKVDEYLWRYTKIDLTADELDLRIEKNGKGISLDEYNKEHKKEQLKEIADIVRIDSSTKYEDLDISLD